MLKKLTFCLAVLIALLIMSVTSATTYAAPHTSKVSELAQQQRTIWWNKGGGGCQGILSVVLQSIDGSGYTLCMQLLNGNPGDYGYLGLGGPGGPGNASKVVHLYSGAAAPGGWIRYYGGAYPNGTFCKYTTGQKVNFAPNLVLVTQVEIGGSNSYHICP